MFPKLGPLPFPNSYGLLVALGLTVALLLIRRFAPRVGIAGQQAQDIFVWSCLAGLLGAGACETSPDDLLGGQSTQLTQPNYPRGIALTPDGDRLVVVSSNFEGQFDTGAVLLADVTRLGADLAFIAPESSPLKGEPMLAVACEMSGTVTLWRVVDRYAE